VKDLLHSASALLLDLAATVLFFLLYRVTHNLPLAVIAGLVLAIGQIGWHLARNQPVDALQWVSLVTVAASGAATLHTGNPLYVMLKPSILYLLVGWAMLQRGWMNRYLPPRALQYVPDLGVRFGYVWAGLMFVSAALNLVLALSLDVASWGVAITSWGISSKAALFLIQYAVMKSIGRRRRQRTALA
jgi:intracellular septation protein A